MSQPLLAISAAVCAASLFGTAAWADVFKVGTGSGCTHRTLEDAVAAASDDIFQQPHVIRLTRAASGAPARVKLTGQLTIVGGYESCLAAEPSGQTTISGYAPNGILEIVGRERTGRPTAITLRNLELVNGRSLRGGAIRISGGALVSMDNVSIYRNQATRAGGGISIQGSAENRTAVSLQRTLVYDNEAPGMPPGVGYGAGGGISCDGIAPADNTTIYLGPGSAVSHNRAIVGGGIYLHWCTLQTNTNGRGEGVFLNQAHHGGGIGAYRSDLQFNSSAGGGLWVAMNSATAYGGGLALAGTRLEGRDLMLTGNRAGQHGGGLYAAADIASAPLFPRENHIRIYGTNGCTAARCPLVEGNIDGSSLGHAIMIASDRPEARRSRLSLANVHFANNGGGGGAIVLAHKTDLGSHGIVSRGNRATSLLDLSATSRGLVEFLTSDDAGTLASVFRTDGDSLLTLRASIVAGNGRHPRVLSSPERTAIQCLLTHEIGSLPGDAQFVFAGDPGFVDRAAGDLRLQSFSPAIDFCNAAGFVHAGERDADGRMRGIDAPAPDRFGRFDLGAYEHQP